MPLSRVEPRRLVAFVPPLSLFALIASMPLVAPRHIVTRDAMVIVADTATPDAIAAGRRIFHGKGTCFACHGPNLEGGPIAPTLRAHAWKDAKNGELSAIIGVITHGVNGTPMVSHPGGISDAEVASVAAYVWSVAHGASP